MQKKTLCMMNLLFRVILGINPTSGSKVQKVRGKKARSGTHEAVLSLVKDIAVHESFDTE